MLDVFKFYVVSPFIFVLQLLFFNKSVGLIVPWISPVLLQLSLQFSSFCMKARHLGHCFEEKVLTFWLLFRSSAEFILPNVRHCTAYGCSNRSNKVGWENLAWHKHRSKHRFCHMARAGTTEHLNMLFFRKICVWRYVSPYYLLEFTTFAVDHDPKRLTSMRFHMETAEVQARL